jgi:uncharacterized protein
MKYLVLLLIVLAGVWWLRQQRRPDRPSSHTPSDPHTMVACTHCGVHVPETEVVPGQRGTYCSEAHRQRHEG